MSRTKKRLEALEGPLRKITVTLQLAARGSESDEEAIARFKRQYPGLTVNPPSAHLADIEAIRRRYQPEGASP